MATTKFVRIVFNPGDFTDENGILQDGTQSIECRDLEEVRKALSEIGSSGVVDHIHIEFRSEDNQFLGSIAAPFKGMMYAASTFGSEL